MECAGCGITAGDLPDDIGDLEMLFEVDERDGKTYCQGCLSLPPGQRWADWG